MTVLWIAPLTMVACKDEIVVCPRDGGQLAETGTPDAARDLGGGPADGDAGKIDASPKDAPRDTNGGELDGDLGHLDASHDLQGGADLAPDGPVPDAALDAAVQDGGADAAWDAGDTGAGDLSGEGGAGDGTTDIGTIVPTPTFSAGAKHSCGITSTGTLKCWGDNAFGQVGGTGSKLSPTAVPSLGPVTAVSAGGSHTCAITTAGGLMCWGRNNDGQLGNGTSGNYLTSPVGVSSLGSGVLAVSAGAYHTCALLTGGALKCWGDNKLGQLGNGTANNAASPTDVLKVSTKVVSLAAGNGHTCAVTAAGAAKCWGDNAKGQLGLSGITYVPQDVTGLGKGVAWITAGQQHTCALNVSGQVLCWGDPQWGKTGSWSYGKPVLVGGISGAVAVGAGTSHSCALDGATVKCWGLNDKGQLGTGRTTYVPVPTDLSLGSAGNKRFAANLLTACGIDGNGALYCWGDNKYGRLGTGDEIATSSPKQVSGLTSGVTAVSVGTVHTCALVSGGVKCWGYNWWGAVGIGSKTSKELKPKSVVGLSSGVTDISANSTLSFAIVNGGLKVWGSSSYGLLGTGKTTDSSLTPISVPGLTSGVTAVSAGNGHVCAIHNGAAKCWGLNTKGKLGHGGTYDANVPTAVFGLSSGVTSIVAGPQHTCAVHGGAAKCWGQDGPWLGAGWIGGDAYKPKSVTGLSSGVDVIVSGAHHVCASLTAGGVKCWGINGTGQLGVNNTATYYTPAAVVGLTKVTQLAAGGDKTIAITSTGVGKIWGDNFYGQLGLGWQGYYFSPLLANGF